MAINQDIQTLGNNITNGIELVSAAIVLQSGTVTVDTFSGLISGINSIPEGGFIYNFIDFTTSGGIGPVYKIGTYGGADAYTL